MRGRGILTEAGGPSRRSAAAMAGWTALSPSNDSSPEPDVSATEDPPGLPRIRRDSDRLEILSVANAKDRYGHRWPDLTDHRLVQWTKIPIGIEGHVGGDGDRHSAVVYHVEDHQYRDRHRGQRCNDDRHLHESIHQAAQRYRRSAACARRKA